MALLRPAAGRHPGDVWVNYDLAGALDRLRPSAREEAVRYYTAARALRPETAHELAHLLERMGRGAEAEAVFRDLADRRPENARHLACLGSHLKDRGRAADAAPILDRAVAAARAAIRLQPDDATAHDNLGIALTARGSWPRPSPHSARRSGSSPTTPRPTSTSAPPCGQGKLRRGHRRIPRGDPAQARRRRAHINLGNARPRGSWTRPSPNSARRSGSSPTRQAHTTSATP